MSFIFSPPGSINASTSSHMTSGHLTSSMKSTLNTPAVNPGPGGSQQLIQVVRTKKMLKGNKKVTCYKDAKKHVAKFLAKRRLENEKEKIFDNKHYAELDKIGVTRDFTLVTRGSRGRSMLFESKRVPSEFVRPLAPNRPRGMMAYDLANNQHVFRAMQEERYLHDPPPPPPPPPAVDPRLLRRCTIVGRAPAGTRGLPGMQQTKEFSFKNTIKQLMRDGGKQFNVFWLKKRVEETVKPNRYSLPTKIETLVKMDPMTYLRKYCYVSAGVKSMIEKRLNLYLTKTKKTLDHKEFMKELTKKMFDIPSADEIQGFLGMLGLRLPENGTVQQVESKPVTWECRDCVLVAVAAERVLYKGLVNALPKDKRFPVCGCVERADFGLMERRLAEVRLRPDTLTLLYSLH